MKPIQIGDTIPQFSLPDQDGKMFDINDVLGRKKLVIFFYPRDGGVYCTREACYFRDLIDAFDDADALIIGISSQSVESHKEFATAHRLPYILLSDKENKVRNLFGVPAKLLGFVHGRVTYVVDTNGKVVFLIDSYTDVQRHVDEALKIALVLKKAG